LTGRENVYLNGAILGMTRNEIDRKFDDIVEFSDVAKFIDTPVKRYSSGMTLRLAFSVAAHLEPEILMVYEVLAVGDIRFKKKCLGKIGEVASQGRTVLYVATTCRRSVDCASEPSWVTGGRPGWSGAWGHRRMLNSGLGVGRQGMAISRRRPAGTSLGFCGPRRGRGGESGCRGHPQAVSDRDGIRV
jgi:energy-coupling factor transporter ATP-binding protein EcfA2